MRVLGATALFIVALVCLLAATRDTSRHEFRKEWRRVMRELERTRDHPTPLLQYPEDWDAPAILPGR